jgi:2-amino-4-hydroxy-6-hydroxymethyldihydropteridine diphosphokinase
MSHRVYLALGTNLGDRLANLQAAQAAMPPAVRVLSASPVYETPPWGIHDQPAFLNQVLLAETELEPAELLAYLKKLEERLGRTPGVRYGPRLIDLDILFYDDLVIDTPGLVIPHPRLVGRAFVLVPLADLAPKLRHPLEGKTVEEMLSATDTSGIEVYKVESIL